MMEKADLTPFLPNFCLVLIKIELVRFELFECLINVLRSRRLRLLYIRGYWNLRSFGSG